MLAAILAASTGCGDGPSGRAAESPSQPTTSAVVPLPTAAAPAFPARVDRIFSAIPRDAEMVGHLPGFRALRESGRTGADLDALVKLVAKESAPKVGLAPADVEAILRSLRGAAVFGWLGAEEDEASLGLMLLADDPSLVDGALRTLAFVETEPHRFEGKLAGRQVHAGWVREIGLLVLSTKERLVDASFETLRGERPPLQGPQVGSGPDPLFLSLALSQQGGLVGADVTTKLTVPFDGPALFELRASGEKVPRVAEVIGPSPHALAGRMPKGAAFATGLSLTRVEGKRLRDLVAELARVDESRRREWPSLADAFVRLKTSLSLADLDAALGEEICVAGYLLDSGPKQGGAEAFSKMTVVGALAVRDEQAARAALKHVGEEIKREQKGTVLTPGKLSVPVDGAVLKVEVRKDVVLFGVGRSADLDKKLAAFGKDQVLASDPAFAGQRKGGHATSHGFAFVDYGAMKTLDPTFAEATKLQALATWVDLGLAPDPNGLSVTLEAQGFAAILGTTAALAVASVQRYLQSAKTAEAKVSVSAIARSAVMAFERESISGPTHKLCRSAPAVPAQVPRGTTYRPVAEPNQDFQTGSDSEGWRCLRFDMTEPLRFRYEYRAGSGYKGPARGGPNPGPNGFEVSAEGDLDGDGKTSLFTLVGKPGPGRTMVLSKELFVVDELE